MELAVKKCKRCSLYLLIFKTFFNETFLGHFQTLCSNLCALSRLGEMTNCILWHGFFLQGNGSSSSQKYETNVNVIPENPPDDNQEEADFNNVSRMTINTCKIPVNTQIESSHSQPEDFDLVSHPNLVIQGMNQLRNSGQLLDVKLVAEGKTFKVRRRIIFFIFCLT